MIVDFRLSFLFALILFLFSYTYAFVFMFCSIVYFFAIVDFMSLFSLRRARFEALRSSRVLSLFSSCLGLISLLISLLLSIYCFYFYISYSIICIIVSSSNTASNTSWGMIYILYNTILYYTILYYILLYYNLLLRRARFEALSSSCVLLLFAQG